MGRLKVDLVMWTHNSVKTLAPVLKRINQVVPFNCVNQCFIVDDHSKDNTQNIAQLHGWEVIKNDGHGISDGANTALKHVETDYFASFEHDLLLSPYWWRSISKLVNHPNFAAACGLRFLPRTNWCHSIDTYLMAHNTGNYGKTLDNTLWCTDVLRGIGGFPKMDNAFCETVLHQKFKALGYRWFVDYTVRSLHLHSGLLDELRHYQFYGANMCELKTKTGLDINLLSKFMRSPLAAFRMAYFTWDPRLLVSYPLCRLAMLGGSLHGCS